MSSAHNLFISIQYHSTIDIFTKYCTMQHKLKPCTWAILAIYQEVKMYWLFCCCDQMAKPSQVGYWLFCCCDQMAKPSQVGYWLFCCCDQMAEPSQVGYWLFCCCDQMAKPSQVGYWLFCCCDQSLSSGVLVVTVLKLSFLK